MIKKPFLYALAAALYIILIVLGINITSKINILPEKTIVIPMIMLSLFVLSALIMGFLFLYEPLKLFMENKKQAALYFFGKTVGFFACFIVLFLILFFLL